MSRTSEQISHMLQSSQRWHAGLQWYDFLLALAFHQDGTGEMMYGENQGLRSDLTFRYEISADRQIHFEFFGLPLYPGKMFARTEVRALKTVAFHLLDGPFVMDEPYHHQSTYRYLLCFASDPFPEGQGHPDKSLLNYYGVRE